MKKLFGINSVYYLIAFAPPLIVYLFVWVGCQNFGISDPLVDPVPCSMAISDAFMGTILPLLLVALVYLVVLKVFLKEEAVKSGTRTFFLLFLLYLIIVALVYIAFVSTTTRFNGFPG